MKPLALLTATSTWLALALGVPATAAPDVIHACASRIDGSLRVVARHDACLPSERRLSWNREGPTGPAGDATGYRIEDANGLQVGALVELFVGVFPLIHFEHNGRLAVLQVHEDRFVGLDSTVWFDGLDCTGTPYIAASANGFFPPPNVSLTGMAPPGRTVVVAPLDRSSVVTFNALSRYFVDSVTASCDNLAEPLTNTGIAGERTVDLSTRFVAPFRIVPLSPVPALMP